MQLKDVLLRARRVLALNKVYGDSTLLVLNKTLLNIVNALLALSRQIFSIKVKAISSVPMDSTKEELTILFLNYHGSKTVFSFVFILGLAKNTTHKSVNVFQILHNLRKSNIMRISSITNDM